MVQKSLLRQAAISLLATRAFGGYVIGDTYDQTNFFDGFDFFSSAGTSIFENNIPFTLLSQVDIFVDGNFYPLAHGLQLLPHLQIIPKELVLTLETCRPNGGLCRI
jgi:hypothetical protein